MDLQEEELEELLQIYDIPFKGWRVHGMAWRSEAYSLKNKS